MGEKDKVISYCPSKFKNYSLQIQISQFSRVISVKYNIQYHPISYLCKQLESKRCANQMINLPQAIFKYTKFIRHKVSYEC